MLAAVILIALYPDWVPARWTSADPKTLDLLTGTPINCLWLERPLWSEAFAAEAAKRGIATLGVIRREGDPIEAARALAKTGFTGGVIEGAFDDYSLMIVSATLAKAKMFYLESGPRSHMKFDSGAPILVTSQGMWPGIHVEKGSTANAGPTANPWIDTNTGFLRYARASTDAAVWLDVPPPPGNVYSVQRYLQAVGDAAMNGGRWVVSLDDDLSKRLIAHDAEALKSWAQIAAALRHYEEHKEWRAARPAGQVAIVEDYAAARLSGGLFDMLAAKHIPVFAVPSAQLSAADLKNAHLAVDYNPAPQSGLRAFPAGGRTLIDAPRGTEKKPLTDDDFVFDSTDPSVNAIWQKVSAAVGRQNMGAKLFNVSSMLSNLVSLRGQHQLVLNLVNYSDYPASGITARVVGNYHRARLYRPGEAPVDLDVEKVEDGTGFAIDQRIVTIATVVME